MAQLGLTPNISDPRKSNYAQTYGGSGALNTTNISGDYGDEEENNIRPLRRAVGYGGGAPNIYGGQLPTVDVGNYAGFRAAKTNADENDLRTASRYSAVARNNAGQAAKEGARALEFGNTTYGQGLVDRANSQMPGLTPPPGSVGAQQPVAAPTTYTQAQHAAYTDAVLKIMGQNKNNPNYTVEQAKKDAVGLVGYNPLAPAPAPQAAPPAFTGTAQDRRTAENAHFAGPQGVGGTQDIGLTQQQRAVMRANNPQMSDDQFDAMVMQKYGVAPDNSDPFAANKYGDASVPRPDLAPPAVPQQVVPESRFGTDNGLDYQQNNQNTAPPYPVNADQGLGGGLNGVNPANQAGRGSRIGIPSMAPPPTMGPPRGADVLPKQNGQTLNKTAVNSSWANLYVTPSITPGGRVGPNAVNNHGQQFGPTGQVPSTQPATQPSFTTASEYPNGPDGKPDMGKKPMRRWRIYPDGRKELIGGQAQ